MRPSPATCWPSALGQSPSQWEMVSSSVDGIRVQPWPQSTVRGTKHKCSAKPEHPVQDNATCSANGTVLNLTTVCGLTVVRGQAGRVKGVHKLQLGVTESLPTVAGLQDPICSSETCFLLPIPATRCTSSHPSFINSWLFLNKPSLY